MASNNRIYVGFSTVDASIKKTQWTDLELIKRDLANAFYTRIGERLMNPTFGCIIWDMLFEPMTESALAQIQENCLSIVEADGRVSVQNFNLIQYDSGIQLQIDLYYAPTNSVDAFSLNFDQKSAQQASS